MTRAHVRLLGPCFKTGRIGGRLSHRDGARHGGAQRASAAGGRSHATALDDTDPRHFPFHRRDAPRSNATEDRPNGRARHRSREAKGCYPTGRTTTAALSAHTDGKCTGRHRRPKNGASEDRVAPSADSGRMNAAEFRRLYPLPSKRFHALLNSLFKVLCNFPSRYLFAIGLVAVFSLR
jgi:hypothetical protein